ncbi:hypothetical protein N0V90_004134 [Kalmusia sp. IMI 367209]|nr:hypothetical protein N0V90_004134 [Kalmusia sp. IMI 367209]
MACRNEGPFSQICPMESTLEHVFAASKSEMHPNHCVNQYIDGPSRLMNVANGDLSKPVTAIILSYSLAQKIRDAICAGHSFRHMSSASEERLRTLSNKQHETKAALDLLGYKIELLMAQLKDGRPGQEKEDELKLLQAFESRPKLQHTLDQVISEQAALNESLNQCRRNFEAGWSKVDCELSMTFEMSGFIVEPAEGEKRHCDHPSCGSSEEERAPEQEHAPEQSLKYDPSKHKGYRSNQLYISSNELQECVPIWVDFCANNFHEARSQFRRWMREFERWCGIWAESNNLPHKSREDMIRNKAEYRNVWNTTALRLGHQKHKARAIYREVYTKARDWGFHDFESWPTQTWISTGPEEENAYSHRRTKFDRVLQWEELLPCAGDMGTMLQWNQVDYSSIEKSVYDGLWSDWHCIAVEYNSSHGSCYESCCYGEKSKGADAPVHVRGRRYVKIGLSQPEQDTPTEAPPHSSPDTTHTILESHTPLIVANLYVLQQELAATNAVWFSKHAEHPVNEAQEDRLNEQSNRTKSSQMRNLSAEKRSSQQHVHWSDAEQADMRVNSPEQPIAQDNAANSVSEMILNEASTSSVPVSTYGARLQAAEAEKHRADVQRYATAKAGSPEPVPAPSLRSTSSKRSIVAFGKYDDLGPLRKKAKATEEPPTTIEEEKFPCSSNEHYKPDANMDITSSTSNHDQELRTGGTKLREDTTDKEHPVSNRPNIQQTTKRKLVNNADDGSRAMKSPRLQILDPAFSFQGRQHRSHLLRRKQTPMTRSRFTALAVLPDIVHDHTIDSVIIKTEAPILNAVARFSFPDNDDDDDEYIGGLCVESKEESSSFHSKTTNNTLLEVNR